MVRHWSFIICDKKYLYPLATVFLTIGIILAIDLDDYQQFNRVGNFIVAIGVWISMRYTFREGIKKTKNVNDSSPIVPRTGGQLNAAYFNNAIFSQGDAELQLHGFFLVIIGSVIGSYGDFILKYLI